MLFCHAVWLRLDTEILAQMKTDELNIYKNILIIY